MRLRGQTSGGIGRVRRRLIGTLAAAAALLVLPASAQALGLSGLSAAPNETQAGAHSDFHIHMEFGNPGDQVKDLTIGLPPGMVGDPNATPAVYVGAAPRGRLPRRHTGRARSVLSRTFVSIPLPVTASGGLYNLEPQPGEPARFGIVLTLRCDSPLDAVLPPIILQSGVQLRDDFGLNTIINDIPNTTNGLPTRH